MQADAQSCGPLAGGTAAPPESAELQTMADSGGADTDAEAASTDDAKIACRAMA
jgi:hypothetical protein